MLLRSVTRHVNDQNWFAVLLDLTIVVVGVFIGIEVANWNAALEGEKRAEVLLERLHEDVSSDLEALTSLLDYHAIVKSYSVTAINGLNGDASVNDEQLVIAAYQASQIAEAWTYRSTYDELLSTGQMNLIKNDELKSLIFGYFADNWSEQALLTTIAPYREFIRGAIPFPIQEAIRSECGDIRIPVASTFGMTLHKSCDLQLPDEAFAETAAYFRSQPDVLVKLRYQIAVFASQIDTLDSFSEEAKTLMAALEDSQKN